MNLKFFKLLFCLSLVFLMILAVGGHVYAQESSGSGICVDTTPHTLRTELTSGDKGLKYGPLSVSASSIDFGSTSTQRTFRITSGWPPVFWEVSSMQSWIMVSPTGGKGSATITVSVNRSGLRAGNYTGYVTVTPTAGSIGTDFTRHIITVYMGVPSSGAGPSSTSRPLEKSRVVFSVPGAASAFISIYDSGGKFIDTVAGAAQSSSQILTISTYLPNGNYRYSAGGKVQNANGVARANFTVNGTTSVTVRLISAGYIPNLPR
ncbi:MAG: BACON domain-containing protein [Chloroflexi bacterium]|nr:BACON domain-containing protein [Chloroflexota bacterium]